MKSYFKCIISFFLGGLCIYLASTMSTEGKENVVIVYFLYGVGLVNVWLGVRDLSYILKNKK